MLKISEEAKSKITELLKNNSEFDGLKIGIRSGGCSGFLYDIGLAKFSKDDILIETFKTVFVDKKSVKFLEECTLIFEKTLMSQSFKIINPSSKKECGCGKSFSI